MKSFVFLPLFLCTLSIKLLSQGVPPNLVPPTPTAYSLGKYGDIPVSLYTGVPDISVPIFTLTDHDVAAPVTLSYHGSGIKVDEIASFVGLGWSLNAGGTITRVVKGRAETLDNKGSLSPKRADIKFYDYHNRPPKDDFIEKNGLYAASHGMVDTEPDEFYYNFQGKSGKFYFDHNANVVSEKQNALEIKWEYVNSTEQRFVIVDELGLRYEFNDYETTFLAEENSNRISAWYLSKITTPTGNSISFQYNGGSSSYQLIRGYSSSVVEITPAYSMITPPAYDPVLGIGYSELRIKRITSSNGSIDFLYNQERRKDYSADHAIGGAAHALQEIVITSPDGTMLKKIKLSTGYFQAKKAFSYNGSNPEQYEFLNYRLRLDAVQEFAGDNASSVPPYKFYYLGNNDPKDANDPFSLPYRLSPAQDHWGYFNHSGNTHLLPGNPSAQRISDEPWFRRISNTEEASVYKSFTNGADREPNSDAVKAGMLREIHYPTGGYTAFYFEANDFSKNIGGVRIARTVDHPNPGIPKEIIYQYSGYVPYNPRDYYYKLYNVVYQHAADGFKPVPSVELLQQLGIPYGNQQYLSGINPVQFVKISTQPLAVLGSGAQVGYYNVKVMEPGNGYTNHVYASPDRYPDYPDHDYMDENTTEELRKLGDLFRAEYISAYSFVDGPEQFMSGYGSSTSWPYPETFSNNWKRGELTNRFTYSEGNKLLKEENFIYNHKLLDVLPGFKVKNLRTGEYILAKYFVPKAISQLKTVEKKDYDMNGENPVAATTNFFYDNPEHLQATRVETTRSDGRSETELTTFPSDYPAGTAFIDNMKVRHLLAFPVEKVKYLHDGSSTKIISGTINQYKPDGSGLVERVLALENSAPLDLNEFNFSNRPAGQLPPLGSPATFTSNTRYNPRILYDKYDTKSNLVQYTSSNGITTSYTWGYDKQYPVAEVKNASEKEFYYTGFEENGKLGNSHTGLHFKDAPYTVNWPIPNNRSYVISYWYRSAGTWKYSGEQAYRSGMFVLAGGDAYDDIRIHPHDAQMTTYTYQPLTGISSSTDARSLTTYFEYDALKRLRTVRDDDKNIIRTYCYNFEGRQADCSLQSFSNKGKSQEFNSICPSGLYGNKVTYTVSPGKYISVVSQQEADGWEQADIDANGQNFANTNGGCRPVYVTMSYENIRKYDTLTIADVVIRFYSDDQKQHAVDPPGIVVNYKKHYNSYDNLQGDFSIICNKVTLVAATIPIHWNEDRGIYIKDYELLPGNYTILP